MPAPAKPKKQPLTTIRARWLEEARAVLASQHLHSLTALAMASRVRVLLEEMAR